MLRLECEVNGRRVARSCEDGAEAVSLAVELLDGCAIEELRLIRVLRSLETAVRCGDTTWGWSATEFALTLTST